MTRWICPSCQSTNLRVVVEVWADLVQEEDGNFQTMETDGDHEWTENSVMLCKDCGEQDIADMFSVEVGEDEDDAEEEKG